MMKIAVLISGRGSNMLRLAEYAGEYAGFEIVLVAANRPCAGLTLAAEQGLATALLDRASYDSKQAHETALGDAIVAAGADMICLAGYMAILSPGFISRFTDNIINIHPSLLPALKGLDTHERALSGGRQFHGATVHVVTALLDDGPILLQAALEIDAEEDADALAGRVLRLEHALYPFVMSSLASGTLTVRNSTVTWHDGTAALARADAHIRDTLSDAVIWPDQTDPTRPDPIRPDKAKLGIDFTRPLGHKPNKTRQMIGGASIMDTSDFDQQAHSHLNTYNSFMNGAKIVGGLVILTLVVMAATLL